MGRHNTIAGRMAESAAAKGKLFTKLARELMVAARNGSDINTNSSLRMAINKAKDHSMPKDNIERAIKKGAGELTATHYDEVTYEGYGPNGSALMIEVLTDNKNRTHPDIRRIFQKHGGTMAEMGAVGWMFKKCGVFIIDSNKFSEDKILEVALEAQAEDVINEEGFTTVYTQATQFAAVREVFVAKEILFEKAGLELIPNTFVSLNTEESAVAIDLIEKLEDQDDVQNVYHNIHFS